MKIWDQGWNANEWFVTIIVIVGFGAVWLLPNRFQRHVKILFVLFGAYFGVLFDHIIAVPPFDFYDVNDKSAFEFIDFITYIMYGPFGYLFLYVYDRLNVPARFAPLYVLLWTVIGMSLEGIGASLGVFHYKDGYRFDYSSSVYLTLQLCALALYHIFTKKREEDKGEPGE